MKFNNCFHFVQTLGSRCFCPFKFPVAKFDLRHDPRPSRRKSGQFNFRGEAFAFEHGNAFVQSLRFDARFC